MRTNGATRLLLLILSLRYVARIQTSLNSCHRSQRQNSVAATMIFTCHTRRFVAATCRARGDLLQHCRARGDLLQHCRGDVSQRFVASCVSALTYEKKAVVWLRIVYPLLFDQNQPCFLLNRLIEGENVQVHFAGLDFCVQIM